MKQWLTPSLQDEVWRTLATKPPLACRSRLTNDSAARGLPQLAQGANGYLKCFVSTDNLFEPQYGYIVKAQLAHTDPSFRYNLWINWHNATYYRSGVPVLYTLVTVCAETPIDRRFRKSSIIVRSSGIPGICFIPNCKKMLCCTNAWPKTPFATIHGYLQVSFEFFASVRETVNAVRLGFVRQIQAVFRFELPGPWQ
jgi:hypothetical protein